MHFWAILKNCWLVRKDNSEISEQETINSSSLHRSQRKLAKYIRFNFISTLDNTQGFIATSFNLVAHPPPYVSVVILKTVVCTAHISTWFQKEQRRRCSQRTICVDLSRSIMKNLRKRLILILLTQNYFLELKSSYGGHFLKILKGK